MISFQGKKRSLLFKVFISAISINLAQGASSSPFSAGGSDREDFCRKINFKSSKSNFYFAKGEQVSSTLNVGEFDLAKEPGGEIKTGGILLFIPKRLTLASISCGNSICISATEVKALCPHVKTYRLSVMTDSLVFGPGSFKTNENLLFYDAQGDEVEESFSLIGAIHKPQSELVASEEDVLQFMKLKTKALVVSIKNTGNRDLIIGEFSDVNNPEEIQLKRNECQWKTVHPNQSCVLQFERPNMPIANSHTNQAYEIAFNSNDAFGLGRLTLFLEHSNRARFYIQHK